MTNALLIFLGGGIGCVAVGIAAVALGYWTARH